MAAAWEQDLDVVTSQTIDTIVHAATTMGMFDAYARQNSKTVWDQLTAVAPPAAPVPALPPGLPTPVQPGKLAPDGAVVHRMIDSPDHTCTKRDPAPAHFCTGAAANCCAPGTPVPAACEAKCCFMAGVSVWAPVDGISARLFADAHVLFLKAALRKRVLAGVEYKNKFRPGGLRGHKLTQRMDQIASRKDLVDLINGYLLPQDIPVVCATARAQDLAPSHRVVTDQSPKPAPPQTPVRQHFHVQPSPGAVTLANLSAMAMALEPVGAWTICSLVLHAAGEISDLRLEPGAAPPPDDPNVALVQDSLLEVIGLWASDVAAPISVDDAFTCAMIAVELGARPEAFLADVMTPELAGMLQQAVKYGLIDTDSPYFGAVATAVETVLDLAPGKLDGMRPGRSRMVYTVSRDVLRGVKTNPVETEQVVTRRVMDVPGVDFAKHLSVEIGTAKEMVRAAFDRRDPDRLLKQLGEALIKQPHLRPEVSAIENVCLQSCGGSVALYFSDMSRAESDQVGNVLGALDDPRLQVAMLALSAQMYIDADRPAPRWDPAGEVVFSGIAEPIQTASVLTTVRQPQRADVVHIRVVAIDGTDFRIGKELARAASSTINELRGACWGETSPHRVLFLTAKDPFVVEDIYGNYQFSDGKATATWCSTLATQAQTHPGLVVETIAGMANRGGEIEHRVLADGGCCVLVIAWSARVADLASGVVRDMAPRFGFTAK
jgi:hypothetical protein